ncbi:hypothetical protein FHS11_001363 [Mucilaginibacter gotjawali]|uniref:Uncharacterized protein n=1 Tax=Mucilaginibacter gotjawali TaxID=1550579 RepID=A0A839SAU4_9SPHI|nr:hypothetical protein [Mucilaginibacter gotjawali]
MRAIGSARPLLCPVSPSKNPSPVFQYRKIIISYFGKIGVFKVNLKEENFKASLLPLFLFI